MAIKDVKTKCYILALFIRDDGARFLLGSGAYEFKDGQQHFAANTIENDVVEVQGNDGYLLAGQVRRPGTQSFDGYVGDSSTSKPAVESLRRDFFQFFRKGYLYKVIYVFPDGSAIQRKRGFLVDAPTVQELYQIYPEYHVALNFEDINYYCYDEDSDGHEIYGKSAIIGSTMPTGGLVWDEDGAVTDSLVFSGVVTVKGAETINNLLNVAVPLDSVALHGNTYQQTYSGKNLLNNTATNRTTNGITFTVNSSGSVVANGTATSGGAWLTVCQGLSVDGECFLSGCPGGGGSSTYSLQTSSPNLSADYGTGASINRTDSFNVFIVIRSGQTVSGLTFWPMIEKGSAATSFEPYVGGVPSPNPDYPQEVEVVTGEQTVEISDDNENTQSYTIDLGSTELCKIGDYQDYIYKDGGAWYLHKEVRHLSRTVANMDNYDNCPGWKNISELSQDFPAGTNVNINTLTDSWDNITGINIKDSGRLIWGANNEFGILFANRNFFGSTWTQTYWTTNYPNLTVELYYGIVVPQADTQITDATLIAQLEALGAAKLYVGENNLLVTANGDNLPAELEVGYYTEIEDGYGFVWEEGSQPSGIVNVDSIDKVYPVLTITGETINPIITNVTTGTVLQYNGTITPSQTLIIDMMAQTATLNGVSVIGNISGDWISFDPGNNRVTYTATNADAPDATIEWQEIVG